ncbi:MAG: DUF427 domain-containing protein [Nocardioides sp.]
MSRLPEDTSTRNFPLMAADRGRVEPAPRRVRGMVEGRTVFDTLRAQYVWEKPYYPWYYVPLEDVDASMLVDEARTQRLQLGTAARMGLRVGETVRAEAARVYDADTGHGLARHVRFEWDALDAWFEEDEQIFVHPRNPYVRVDALRSQRHVRVELDGVLLAETRSPVLLFETGLPTRYYVDPADVRFGHLESSETESSCPYKGTTSDYWSAHIGDEVHEDLAWSYRSPLSAVARIAGLVAFYDERVDVIVDGDVMPRPRTHFFS